MIKLFSLKQQKKDEEGSARAGGSQKKASAAQLRITKDLNELNLPKTCSTEFPDPDDLLNFKLIICPDEGFYRGGRFVFSFKVGPNYPHEPPKVKCETAVYHPNIDLEGNVCLNILREDWKPVLTVNSIVYGLQYLFLEPNPEDPLNKEAADELQSNRRLFEQHVQRAMRGGQSCFDTPLGCESLRDDIQVRADIGRQGNAHRTRIAYCCYVRSLIASSKNYKVMQMSSERFYTRGNQKTIHNFNKL
ncbi:unnamed protein product [Arctia plantaginis]|uniref:E2 NEDD8-conjugating enzyme n=1 Tax=Arctia plantaginis TaxID=874455 RepID=A0A8S1B928_ARCPL|nr:unnamed protein product [Arctia plantaginis]